jgi:hypothetical protein
MAEQENKKTLGILDSSYVTSFPGLVSYWFCQQIAAFEIVWSVGLIATPQVCVTTLAARGVLN